MMTLCDRALPDASRPMRCAPQHGYTMSIDMNLKHRQHMSLHFLLRISLDD